MLREGRLHIPLAGKVVITFRGQGSAGSIVGFEAIKIYAYARARYKRGKISTNRCGKVRGERRIFIGDGYTERLPFSRI